MKVVKQGLWAVLAAVCISTISWAQYPYGASDMTYGLRSRIADNPSFQYTPSPEDWRDINIYQLFTDRFADSGDQLASYRPAWKTEGKNFPYNRNFHHGGDWNGLKNNLDYLSNMGVKAIWMSGVQMNEQGKDFNYTPYHQYHPTDFFRVDPAMGTFQDLKDLIDECHARGIYVILDVVINHTADLNGLWGNNQNDDKQYWGGGNGTFGWWSDRRHAAPFTELSHFHNNGTINNWDASPENLLGQFKGTDDLKTEDTWVQERLAEAFKNLISATDCDGFRVDAIKHVEYNWCKKWADDMRKHADSLGKKNFILFGELFTYDNNALASYCKDPGYSYNSALFFPLSQNIKNVFVDGQNPGQLTQQLNNRSMYGEGGNNLVAFIDNHDLNRIALMNGGDTGNDVWKLRPALSFLYLATPVPCLYYGTEHAFDQGGHYNGSNKTQDNPDDGDWQRECMFDKGFQPGPAQGNKLAATNAPLYQHIAALNAARATYKSLTRGSFQEKWTDGAYAFSRVLDSEEALVAINLGDGNKAMSVQVGKSNTEFTNVLNPTEKVTSSGTTLSFSLSGKETKVFVAGLAAPQLWVRGTHNYPLAGEVTSETPVYINTEAGPVAAVTNVILGYSLDGGTTWTTEVMLVNAEWSSQGGAWYNASLGVLPASSAVKYYIEVQGTGGAKVWDNNNSLNFAFNVIPGGSGLWVRGTKNYPLDGDATSASDIYIDTEAGPSSVVQNVTAYYIVGSVTTSVAMVKNTSWDSDGGHWYNANLGKFEAGTTIRYFIEATDGEEVVRSDNGGLFFSLGVRGAPLSITNPVSDLAVAYSVTNVSLQGNAEADVVGPLYWTNVLTGASGEIALGQTWSINNIGLGVGANQIVVYAKRPGSGTGGIVAQDSAANYTAWNDGDNNGSGFAPWEFNHSQAAGAAGVFIGDPAAAQITGFNTNAFGFYANPPNSGANAEVMRNFTSAMTTGAVFSFDWGLNWDSNYTNSYRGMSLLAGSTELLYINMQTGPAVRINGGIMFANYGAQKMPLSFEYLASGSIRVTGTGRDGSESYAQTLTVPAGAPSRIKFYFNATDSGTDERQMYVDNLKITSPEATLLDVSAVITIVRADEDTQDSNSDGIPDWWCIENGLNPEDDVGSQRTPNGYTYYEAYVLNLDPADMSVPPFVLELTSNGPTFTAPGDARKYVYQFTPDLSQEFEDVGEPVFVGQPMTFNGEAVGFYRIRYVDESGSGTGQVESVSVSATPGNQSFSSATGLAVRLNVSGVNVVSSQYSINLGTRVNFRDNDVIVIGAGSTNKQVTTLTVYGETANGTKANVTYGYTYNDNTVTQRLASVGGTHHWVSDANQVFINSAGYPEGSTVSADIIYCVNGACTGDWPLVQMSRNPDWENGDWWNKDLGTLNDGDTVEFAIVMRDAFDTEVWDNNGGANYSVTIGGGGGSVTNGPTTPYSTNPTFGRRGTKTIDGSASDWSDADLIALDKANDDPRSLGSNWTMHEAPLDLTHMWANWDNDYLYLAWQYVDVTDVLDPANAGGAGSGKISSNDGILQWIVIDTIAGSGATSDMWKKFNSWTGANKPNYQIYLAGSLWQGYISRAVDGVFPVDDGGVNYKTVAAAGITVAKGSVFGGTSLLGHGDADDRSGTSMRNFLNEGHSTTRDSFYEMRIPLSYLGITASTLDNNGIGGVMIGAGSASSMDSIPHDEATLNTQGTETWNSSLEWGDIDIFTSPFARIGGGN